MARTRKPPKRHESAETEEPSPSDKEQEDRAPSAGKGEPLDLEQIEIPDDNWEVPYVGAFGPVPFGRSELICKGS